MDCPDCKVEATCFDSANIKLYSFAWVCPVCETITDVVRSKSTQ